MVNLFSGTRLTFGAVEKVKTGRKLKKSAKKVKKSAEKLMTGGNGTGQAPAHAIRSQVEEFIKTCSDIDNINDVVEAISAETFQELVSEVTPFVGIASSGIKAIKAGKAVADDGKKLYKSKDYKKGFRLGDPLAAAEAVQTIIKRDMAKDSVNLARHSAVTGAKVAGLFLDLGTATTAGLGLGNAVAGLGLELFTLGIEIKEMRAGNARLANPASLDLTVFSECPILGCYLLTCADTSTVANMFIADIGLPGWMDKVEALKKKKMDPLLKIAAKDIQKSRLQLTGLAGNKGTHMEKGFFARKKSAAMRQLGYA